MSSKIIIKVENSLKVIFLFLSFSLFFLGAINNVKANDLVNCSELSNTSFKSISNWIDSPISNEIPIENNLAKECALESIKNSMQQEVLQKVSKSTIDWVNSGFDGRPAYMTDPYDVLRSTTERVVEDVIYGNETLKFVASDFELPLKFAINDYYFNKNPGELNYQPVSTLDESDENAAFSWEGFVNSGLNPNNNLFSLYYNTIDSIDEVVAVRENNLKEEIERGKGYFSLRECEDGWEYDGSPEASKHCRIVTPGYTIAEQVGKAVSSDLDRAVFANETDELMGNLVEGLLNKTLSGGGLASISDPDYSSIDSKSDMFNLEKERLLIQFDTRIYDVAIKILESEKRTLGLVKNILQESISCWNDKDGGQKNAEVFYSNSLSDNEYEILTKTTVYNHMDYVNNNDYFLDLEKDIDKINQNISLLKSERSKTEEIQIMITLAENYSGLHDIVNYSNVSIVDLNLSKINRNKLENKYNDFINGKITSYNSSNPVRMSGIGTSNNYCQSFNLKSKLGGIVADSQSEINLINEKEIEFIDEYDSYFDMLNLGNFTEFDINNNSNEEIPEYEKKVFYKDIISLKYPTKAKDSVYNNFKDFFLKEEKTEFNDGKEYLANLNKFYFGNFFNYSFNSYLVDKKLTYKEEILNKSLYRVDGTGEYCTEDGWSSYKVYLPPAVDKIALLFKPERNILHRVHLTYNPTNTINHENAKNLVYENISSDNNHYGLTDLFKNEKTVLMNIKYNGSFLEDKKIGVSVGGLVLGKEEIKEYLGDSGGWIYIDIAQDLDALGKQIYSKDNKVKIFYYVDTDTHVNKYSDWLENLDLYIKEKGVLVIENKCD